MTPTYAQNRPRVVFDTECYPNYWSIGFRNPVNGRYVVHERTDSKELDRAAIAAVIRKYCIVGFNSNNYDIPMILMAMTGVSNAKLKECNDQLNECNDKLIPNNGEKWATFRPWQFIEHYGLRVPRFLDHIDLLEVSPAAASRLSLKLYGGRLHSRTMRDLPFDPHKPLTQREIRVIRDEYLPNDLELTADLLAELSTQINIREAMSRQHDMDLRSKSDAQIAEAVIRKSVEAKLGHRIFKPTIRPFTFNYVAPEFIEFHTPGLRQLLHQITTTKFIVRSDGYVLAPDYLKSKPTFIDGTAFQMGIGGLHSVESSVSHYADEDTEIVDRDVRGYYPNQIIKSGKGPSAMGPHFQPVYRGIVREREVAKAAGDKDRAEGGKVMANGTFGKTSQPGSVLYAPEMMIQTTLSGQLSILMLIEQFGQHGFKVISANTDGLVTLVDKSRRWLFESIIFDWEVSTGLVTEETCYRSLHSRDVNSYVAIETNGKAKVKGQYAKCGPGQPAAMGLKKTPEAQVCSDAVVKFLQDGTPVEQTIRADRDVRNFVVVRRVKGGCETADGYLGKAVRWYHSTDVHDSLREIKTGKAVAGSLGAMPMMTLPDGNVLPDDIDIDWYIREAYARLQDAGVAVEDPALRGRTGTVIGRLPEQKTYHYVDAATGRALCGRDRKSIRDAWVEVVAVPDGFRLCSKCKKEHDL